MHSYPLHVFFLYPLGMFYARRPVSDLLDSNWSLSTVSQQLLHALLIGSCGLELGQSDLLMIRPPREMCMTHHKLQSPINFHPQGFSCFEASYRELIAQDCKYTVKVIVSPRVHSQEEQEEMTDCLRMRLLRTVRTMTYLLCKSRLT